MLVPTKHQLYLHYSFQYTSLVVSSHILALYIYFYYKYNISVNDNNTWPLWLLSDFPWVPATLCILWPLAKTASFLFIGFSGCTLDSHVKTCSLFVKDQLQHFSAIPWDTVGHPSWVSCLLQLVPACQPYRLQWRLFTPLWVFLWVRTSCDCSFDRNTSYTFSFWLFSSCKSLLETCRVFLVLNAFVENLRYAYLLLALIFFQTAKWPRAAVLKRL